MNNVKPANLGSGFTLIELLVAIGILAWIMVVAQVVIQTATKAGDISAQRSQQLKDLDRVWILLETDLRNVVNNKYTPSFGEAVEPLLLSQSEEYILVFLRGGQKNALLLPRSEVLRVGYRIEDGEFWRDTWIDPYNVDEEYARSQKLIEGVENLEILALPRAPAGRSVEQGPWLDVWPVSGQGSGQSASQNTTTLPMALELKLTLEKRGELRRLITLPRGGI